MNRQPLLTRPQHRILLGVATAIYGLTIAIAAYPAWLRPAPPSQLPGYMTALNLDAHASFRFFLSLLALAIGLPFLSRRFILRLADDDSRGWATWAFFASVATALWYVSVSRSLLWGIVPTAAAIAACVVFRRVDARFSRRDAILLPCAGGLLIAFLDCTDMTVQQSLMSALVIVAAVRASILFVRRDQGLPPALCFAVAPLATITESHFFDASQRYAGWPAIVLVTVTPFLLRLFVPDTPAARRRLRAAIVLAIYPLTAYGYASATGIVTAERKPRVDFFEDGHNLPVASELLRGERPYTDIIPSHGLIQDGLFDAALLRHGPPTIGTALKARWTLSNVTAIAGYAIATAVTGSADVGLFSVFGAALLGYSTGSIRFLPAVVSLAVAAFAVRRRHRGLLGAASALAVIAVLTSVDFGAFACAGVLIAAFMFEGHRSRALTEALGVGTATFAVSAIMMMIGGFFLDFVRVTVSEILSLAPVYAPNPFTAPAGFARPFPEMLTSIFEPRVILYFVWIGALVGLGTIAMSGIQSRSVRRRSVQALLLVAVWVVLVGISYAERHHLYFTFAAMPLIAGFASLLLTSRRATPRAAGIAVVGLLIIVGTITSHISVVGIVRRAHGPLDPQWHEVGLPRAQGALFRDSDIAVIDTVYRYSKAHLRDGETFFDFTDRALLYFLLDRPIPVRQIETAFYETEARQREVIDRLQDRSVRFALVPTGPAQGVDGVGNEVRAPLVWRYLQENFTPATREGEVEIWARK